MDARMDTRKNNIALTHNFSRISLQKQVKGMHLLANILLKIWTDCLFIKRYVLSLTVILLWKTSSVTNHATAYQH